MKSIFLLSTLLLPVLVFSQYRISGKISENGKKPARQASVSLVRPDTTLVKAGLTAEDGSFKLEGIKPGNYAVMATMVGYSPAIIRVSIKDKNMELPEIKLQENTKTLQNVTVTALKPFLEQRADKLIVNVENSPVAAGGTALEILQKVPGVMLVGEKISIVGKPNVMIMIDGRPSQYTDITQLLRDMPSSNIEKFEVIANPSAKYDASGGAIINVVLKKNANLGTNGSVSLTIGSGLIKKQGPVDRNFSRVAPSVSLNHRKGQWNIYGGYSFLHRNTFQYNEFDRQIAPYQFSQKTYMPSDVNSHNYRAGVDFFADKKNTFGVFARGFYREGSNNSRNHTDQVRLSDGVTISSFETLNYSNFKRTNIAADFNWKHSFDTSGRELNFDVDVSKFNLDNFGTITNILSTKTYKNTQDVTNPVKLLVAKLDYTHPFSKTTKAELGVKTSMATIDNALIFKQEGILLPSKSSDFKYQENINAGYVTFSHKTGKWDFMAGVRAEQTIASGRSAGVKTLDRNYLQWFPSAFVSRAITDKISTIAQYSRRVNRPSFQQQNPFVFYMDSITYTAGNPLLRPEISDGFQLNFTYQNQPFFGVSYNTTKDVIFQNAPKQVGNLTYAIPENLAKFENITVMVNLPLKFGKKIDGFASNQLVNNHYKAKYLDLVYDQHKWNYTLFAQMSYKPVPSWSFEASAFYITKFLNEFVTLEPISNISFGVQHFMWERKGRISLNISDAFYGNTETGRIDYSNIHVQFRQRSESRNARLSFVYSFGNQKLKAVRNRSTGSDTENNRVKSN
ncbi:MAG: hypothetical protein JWN76_1871 [Chitinophagaceae bacterium]|nr:hypothetical protein [Chitinophagaceae bacterium]